MRAFYFVTVLLLHLAACRSTPTNNNNAGDNTPGDGPQITPCAGILCSSQGTCVNTNGVASCKCNEGYSPDALGCVKNISAGSTLLNLRLDDPGNTTQISTAVRSGVPFPQGLLPAFQSVAAFVGEQRLPTQQRTLSTWPDGSVRWLLLDTEIDLSAQKKTSVALRILNETPTFASAVTITEDAERISVDTGPMQVDIPKRNGSLIERVRVDGAEVFSCGAEADCGPFVIQGGTRFYGKNLKDNSVPIAGDRITDFLAYSTMGDMPAIEYQRFHPWDLEVDVEEAGPLHTVIRISGAHLSSTGASFGSFITRLHFFRGKRAIDIQHQFVFTGAGNDEPVTGYGIALPFIGSEFSADGARTTAGATIEHTAYTQYILGTMNTVGQAAPVISSSNTSGIGVAVFLRDMAEKFPKALRADGASISIELYPQGGTPWDLSRYATTLDPGPADSDGGGETSATQERGAQGVATGDRFLLSFSTRKFDAAKLGEQAKAYDKGDLHLWAPAQWYSDARVMGVGPFNFSPQENGNQVHFRIDRILRITEDWMRFNQRQQFGWYGIEDYGDIRGWFLGGADKAEWYVRGRYGWSGNSGEPNNQLWLQCLRTQRRDCFTDAVALAQHTMNQQMVHFGSGRSELGGAGTNNPSSVGSLHRHGMQPWSGYAGQPEYSHVAGIETYYYLTGDGRAKETLYEAAQFIYRYGTQYTYDVNGIDVLSRAAAVFYEDTFTVKRFETRIDDMLDSLLQPGEIADKLDSEKSLAFIRMLPGPQYHMERTGALKAASVILAAADHVLSNASSWGIDTSSSNGALKIHMPIIAHAIEVARLRGVDGTGYRTLTQAMLERSTLKDAGADNDAIPLGHLLMLPSNWRNWEFEWEFDGQPPKLLWISRQVSFRNNDMLGYHMYRNFVALSTAAAAIAPTTPGLMAR